MRVAARSGAAATLCHISPMVSRTARHLALLLIRGRIRTQSGASAVEYALVMVLIAVAIIVAVTVFGSSTAGLFRKSCSSLPLGGSSSC